MSTTEVIIIVYAGLISVIAGLFVAWLFFR